jgi:hypothetical protein
VNGEMGKEAAQNEMEHQNESSGQAGQSWHKKLWNSRIEQGWQWLLYLDFLLPAVLFLLAWLPLSMRTFFAQLYHQYTLFIIKPVPNFSSMTGIIGLLIHIGLIIRAIIRRKWLDLSVCLFFLGVLLAFFLIEIDGTALNYHVIRLLDFGVNTSR